MRGRSRQLRGDKRDLIKGERNGDRNIVPSILFLFFVILFSMYNVYYFIFWGGGMLWVFFCSVFCHLSPAFRVITVLPGCNNL